jgi:hypothetical protein
MIVNDMCWWSVSARSEYYEQVGGDEQFKYCYLIHVFAVTTKLAIRENSLFSFNFLEKKNIYTSFYII